MPFSWKTALVKALKIKKIKKFSVTEIVLTTFTKKTVLLIYV